MDNQILYIVTGLPYSGKTTLIKELVKRLGFAVASVDEFLSKGKYVVEDMTQVDWNDVYGQAYEKLEELLKERKSVIFDGASLKKSERDCLKEIAEKLGVKSKLIYVKTSVNEIKRRVGKNRMLKERADVKNITLKKAIEMFEELTENEKAVIYEYGEDLSKWLDKNLNLEN